MKDKGRVEIKVATQEKENMGSNRSERETERERDRLASRV